MNKWVGVVTMGALVALSGCQKHDEAAKDSAKPAASMSADERVSYSVGATLAQNLKTSVPGLNIDEFAHAVKDVYTGHELSMSQEDIANTLQQFQQQRKQEMQKEQQELSDRNKKTAEAFLADNAKRNEVKTTASGLQYEVIKAGQGAQPKADDVVEINYEGKHLDGSVFDSALDPKEPVTFRVDEVIPGWQEALKMMHVGDEWTVYIPASLAYGPAGLGMNGPIGPNETLVFKINLLKTGADEAGAAAH